MLVQGVIMRQIAIRYHVSRTSKVRSTSWRVLQEGNLKLLNVGMEVRDTVVAGQINVESQSPLNEIKCPLLLKMTI
jgi:hypothetical protein